MTRRWTVAAVVMAILGFLSYARFLVVPPSVTAYECPTVGGVGLCYELVEVDPVAILLQAALNAAIWFGVVYLVFLMTRAVSSAIRSLNARRKR